MLEKKDVHLQLDAVQLGMKLLHSHCIDDIFIYFGQNIERLK